MSTAANIPITAGWIPDQVATLTPQTVVVNNSLDVDGYIATARNSITLVNGNNLDLDPSQSYIRASGPTAAFSIHGIVVRNTDGQHLYLHNTTLFAMTIKHESATELTASRRIKTMTVADVVLAARNSCAHFIYDGAISRWVLMSYQ